MADPFTRRRIASVALLSQAVAEPLTYLIPDHLCDRVSLGSAVVVPLQRRLTSGIVVGLSVQAELVEAEPAEAEPAEAEPAEAEPAEAEPAEAELAEAELKPIHAVLDDRPALNPAQLELARWIAAEYHAPLGRCCA
ncbi:MAG: hypothetical protein RMN52_03815, partial [Anaerolineae bacterium]|nr:hypothetical protein [Candidatus Roseilinea sp.]MDW8449109.1 hypothetical protein [Anaerolineae bacterium]